MTRDKKKAKDRWEYVSDRLCNSDYPIYNEEHELESAFDAGVAWADAHPQDRWISVEDELPPNNGSGFSNEVLAYDSMYYRWMITSYDYRCNLWLMCERVTHWMPLPKPPKKGGEQ